MEYAWLIAMIIALVGYIITQLGCCYENITITIVGFMIMYISIFFIITFHK